MKKTIALLFVLTSMATVQGQTTELIKKYHDPYTHSQLSEVYSVISGTYTKHGAYKSYDAKGHLTQEGSYLNGKETGTWKKYYGAATASLHNDPENWLDKLWETCDYKDGKRHGYRAKYSYPNGVKQFSHEWTYENGEIIKEVLYYDNGQKKASYQLNGECKDWDEEGNIVAEHVYESGEPIKSIEYYANGQMKTLLQLNGECGEWYEDGSKKKEYKFVNGNVVGEYKEWYENGQLMFDNVYDEDSNLVSEKHFDQEGNIIK